MRFLEPDEVRELKRFAWFLLLTNLCILGVGALLGRALEDPRGALLLVLGVAMLVNAAFLVIVGGNVGLVVWTRWLHGRTK